MTLPQARQLQRKWVERLRLLDWDIKLRFARKDEEESAWGLAYTDSHAKQATIVLVHPKHPAWGTGDHPRDIEVIIVHELLHLHFAPFNNKSGSVAEVIEENAVNVLSRLLVALDRGDGSLVTGADWKLSKIARILPYTT